MTPQLLQERGVPAIQIDMVVQGLARLHQILTRQDAARALDNLSSSVSSGSVPDGAIASRRLQEFTFPARTPGIGTALAWLRRTWYGVAAKWAVRYLIQQGNEIIAAQEILNRGHHVVLQSVLQRLLDLESADTELALQMARLALKEEKEAVARDA